MFISYSTNDIRFIEKIELMLLKNFRNKIKYIISAADKEIGKRIPVKIIEHIEECEWFMILLTKNSVKNPTVIYEFSHASTLFRQGRINLLIPIVERIKDKKGKDIFINTGVFIDQNVESAKYFTDEEKWDECIRELEDYLNKAYDEYKKPKYIKLGIEAVRLAGSGYNWEAAEHFKKAARILEKDGKYKEAIEYYTNSSKQYEKGEEYPWESSRQYKYIAQIYKKLGDIIKAALYYEKRGGILSKEMDDYSWEAAKSFEEAGKLYWKNNELEKVKTAFKRALDIYEEEENDIESEKIKNILRKI